MNMCRNWAMRSITFGAVLVALLIIDLQPGHAEQGQPVAPSGVTTQTNTVLTTVTVGDRPNGIAVNSNTNRVYVTNYGDGMVNILDGETKTIIARVKVGGNLAGVAVNPITNRIYVGSSNDNTVNVLDGNTNAVIATVKMEARPYRIAVNPTTNRIYVTTFDDKSLRVIDGDTNTIITTVGAGASQGGVAVNPVTNRVYIANRSQVRVLAEKTYTVTATVRIGDNPGDSPKDLAVNTTTNQIFVTHLIAPDDMLRVIDGKTNTLIATVKVGHLPQRVAVDPTTGQLYVTNKDNTVSVINENTRAVVATVSMAMNSAPSAVAVNPKTQQVYIANMYTQTVSIFDGDAFLTPSQRANAGKQDATDGATPPPFEEHFSTGTLDLTRWGVMQNVIGPGGTIEIVGTNPTDRRLRLRIEKNTQPHYRVHGIYTKDAVIDFEHPQITEINVNVDWSNIADSREELVAGIEICPTICKKNLQEEAPNYLQVMYHGNWDKPTRAHIEVRARISNESVAPGHLGGEYTLFDEGYNAANVADRPFAGRKLGKQHLRILVSENEIAVWENDNLIYEQSFAQLAGLASSLPWLNGHLYLVQSGVENKPARDVFFSNLSVRQLPDQPRPQ